MRQYSPSNCQFTAVRLLGSHRRPEEDIFENSDPTLCSPTSLLSCCKLTILHALSKLARILRTDVVNDLLLIEQACVVVAIKAPIGGHDRYRLSGQSGDPLNTRREQLGIGRSRFPIECPVPYVSGTW